MKNLDVYGFYLNSILYILLNGENAMLKRIFVGKKLYFAIEHIPEILFFVNGLHLYI